MLCHWITTAVVAVAACTPQPGEPGEPGDLRAVGGLAGPEVGRVRRLRLASVEEQLAAAGLQRRAAQGKTSLERLLALQAAAEAYRVVGVLWPGPGSEQCEAAFRRGELERILGRPGVARSAFQQAVDAAPGSTLELRARLEMAHLDRRLGLYQRALLAYQALAARVEAPLRLANDGREWAGRTLLDLGRYAEAARTFQQWQERAENQVEALTAADSRAIALIRGGSPQAGRQLLAHLQQSLAYAAAEESEQGRALARALSRLKAPRLLAELGDGDGGGELGGMAEADADGDDAVLLRDLGGAPVQGQARAAPTIRPHLKVAKGDPAGPAGAEHFHRGFLGGEARCQMNIGVAPARALLQFGGGEQALAHAGAAALEAGGKALDLDQVDAQARNCSGKSCGHPSRQDSGGTPGRGTMDGS